MSVAANVNTSDVQWHLLLKGFNWDGSATFIFPPHTEGWSAAWCYRNMQQNRAKMGQKQRQRKLRILTIFPVIHAYHQRRQWYSPSLQPISLKMFVISLKTETPLARSENSFQKKILAMESTAGDVLSPKSIVIFTVFIKLKPVITSDSNFVRR